MGESHWGRFDQLDGTGDDQVDTVDLALGASSSDRRPLDSRVRPFSIVLGHSEAADRPPERAEHLPELHVVAVDGASRHRLVAREEVVVAAESADRQIPATEPPRVGADPPEIAHRVADVGCLPVENRVEADGRIDHHVAVAEVVVNEGDLVVLRQSFHQPPGGEIDHRLGRRVLPVALPGLSQVLRRRQLGEHLANPGCSHVDLVNPGELLTALVGEARPDLVEVGGADDTCTEGDPVEPLHEEADTDTVVVLKHVVHGGLGNAGGLSRLHQECLDVQSDGGFGLAVDPTGAAAHTDRALTLGRVDRQSVRLHARASGQPFDLDERSRSWNLARYDDSERVEELGPGGRHALSRPVAGCRRSSVRPDATSRVHRARFCRRPRRSGSTRLR